jgi:guanylate kinase
MSIFIAPPDLETLEARLRDRGTESEETLNARITSAKGELRQKGLYDHVVINQDLEVAANTVQNLLLDR